jgi:hypothetical protein
VKPDYLIDGMLQRRFLYSFTGALHRQAESHTLSSSRAKPTTSDALGTTRWG